MSLIGGMVWNRPPGRAIPTRLPRLQLLAKCEEVPLYPRLVFEDREGDCVVEFEDWIANRTPRTMVV